MYSSSSVGQLGAVSHGAVVLPVRGADDFVEDEAQTGCEGDP